MAPPDLIALLLRFQAVNAKIISQGNIPTVADMAELQACIEALVDYKDRLDLPAEVG